MKKTILVDAKYPNHTRAVLLDEKRFIEEIEWETPQIKGNIYLAKVSRIEPALQAVFITYENGKSGFLPFFEIHPDLFILPEKTASNDQAEIPPLSDSPENIDEIKQNNSATPLNLEESDSSLNTEAIKIDFETLTEEVDNTRSHYQAMYKKYNVQDVIKKDQVFLVQAIKESKGNKAAFFSTFLSLAGKFCVLMVNTPNQHGISRRIINHEERKRLKDIINEIVDNNKSLEFSLTIRTAGVNRSFEEIEKDYEYLIKTWEKITQNSAKTKAPNIVYTEESIVTKIVRDMLDDRVEELVIEGNKQYRQATLFFEQIFPAAASKIREHKSTEPIFSAFQVEEQVMSLYQPIVPLPSGGYVVINPTEALTSIDVNSGKSINEQNIEETALKTNIEAAKQIAKHLRLREISGLIIVDFIDMQENKNRRVIEQVFKEALSRDKARIQVSAISSLGLMELSRQRLKPSFLESHATLCKYCSGKGLVRSLEANSVLVLRTIAKELSETKEKISVLNVFGHIDAISYLLNKKRKEVYGLEDQFGVELNFYEDKQATAESFSIEKILLKSSNLVDNKNFENKSEPKKKSFKNRSRKKPKT